MSNTSTDFDNTDENFSKLISEQLVSVNSVVYELADAISISASKSTTVVTDFLFAMTEYVSSISNTTNTLVAYYEALSAKMDSLSDSMQSMSNSYKFSDILNNISASMIALSESQTNDDDYAIIDKSSVREFEIPDTIAIPVGPNRIRISTNLLVTIIGIIITVIISLSGANQQQQKEQTELLRDILESIDASNSSQREYFEYTHSVLEDLSSDFQDSEEAPGSRPSSIDNKNKPTNTESEN
ncbi:hypothetical protein DWW31_14160 [Clostridium sp. AF15-17LB]|nr:hypothetical protein DWW31_14160 [Clostridium sp. AF15-17LB]